MQKLINSSKNYFPTLKIKYKNNSFFMKLLSYVLFFNKTFMTKYTTTVGSTIYFPDESFVRSRPISSSIILLHELVHVYSSNELGNFLYIFLYLFPISLLPISLILFLFNWKIALILLIISLLPLPSYFRMYFERRAYFVSLYVIQALSKKLNFNPFLEKQKDFFLSQFKDSSYYFMWTFSNIDKQFDDALIKVKDGKYPYNDSIFRIIDELISQVETTK